MAMDRTRHQLGVAQPVLDPELRSLARVLQAAESIKFLE